MKQLLLIHFLGSILQVCYPPRAGSCRAGTEGLAVINALQGQLSASALGLSGPGNPVQGQGLGPGLSAPGETKLC